MKSYIEKPALLCFLLTLTISGSYSQEAKRTFETKFTIVPPVIDGLENDECWTTVEWSGDFVQIQPQENKPPSQKTAFKILYDDDNLYVFIRAFDTEPEKISRIMTRRDNLNGELAGIFIDSYFDKQTAFSFIATASGAKGDEVITQNGYNSDDSWNPVWFLETSVDDMGWCAEMKIPLSQLRFGKKDEQVWGIQVSRQIYRLEERSDWQFIPKGAPGTIHLYGELHGIKNIVPKHHIELLPYVVGKVEKFEKVEGNPFLNGKSSKVSAGLDGKIGLTNDFTLDFTINPDFGQVEADPSEVNLSAFETYFSERRPFFIEGKNIYQFSPNQSIVINKMYSDNLFYSRRIGRYPHNYPQTTEGEYFKMPESTTILGAAKLSGKTKNGLSLGILESITQKEDALIDNNGERRKESVEPFTNYFIGRIKQDFNKGETVLGGMITAVNRNITNPAMFYLPASAYTGGIDFQRNWKERTWYMAANAEFSSKRQRGSSVPCSGLRQGIISDLIKLLRLIHHWFTLRPGGTVKLGRGSQKKPVRNKPDLRSPGLGFNDIGYDGIPYHSSHVPGSLIISGIPFAIFNNFCITNYWICWNISGSFCQYTQI
jgi:hypothetical protein